MNIFDLFSVFGRSEAQQLLDGALRNAGLHPKLLPDAVKITTLKLLKEVESKPSDRLRASAAELLSYLSLGLEEFSAVTSPARAGAAEARIMAALGDGDGLDAQLILLMLHAGCVDHNVTNRFDLAIG